MHCCIAAQLTFRSPPAPTLRAVLLRCVHPAIGTTPAATSPGDQGSLEVWEALVQVKERTDGTSGVEYVPLSTKRKHAYHSTLSFTTGGMALLAGLGNASFPQGTQ